MAQTHEELIFAKCKESLEDVGGWKVFIFLPHSFMWRLFIVVTVVFTYTMRTFEFFYGLTFVDYNYAELICNVLYFVDALCATLHALMVNTRKLRHGKKRSFLFLLVDYFSLIPYEIFYDFFIYMENHNFMTRAMKKLRINVCLRMYQVFLLFDETRYWIYKMKIYCFVTFIAGLSGIIIVTHLFSCIYFYFLNDEDKAVCLKNPLNCIIKTELLAYSFLSQSYMQVSYAHSLDSSSFFTALYFITGYILTYALLLPFLYFGIFNFLQSFKEFSNRQDQLNLLMNNLTSDKAVQQKIVIYFETIWKYGKGSKKPDVIKLFPMCMQKSIFCDVHWDAFKHSQLLNTLTLGCKRSISMYMRKDFILPNTPILVRNQEKYGLIYLESGVIQIMAEENDASPVIAFSGGTVLCEMSLFHQIKSNAILKTATLCVIHMLCHEDFMRVMLDFPQDKRKLFDIMRYRMRMARATYERKTKICPYFAENQVSFLKEKGNIKWIKQQFRSILEIDKLIKKERFSPAVSKNFPGLSAQMDHTSLFFSLIAINDIMVKKHQTVCVETKLPWYLDPDSDFVKVWNKIIIFFTFVTSTLYPFFIGWYPELPQWFFNFSIFTTFVYTIDVFITLFTAIKNNNSIVTKFGIVFNKRMRSVNFYMDVLAALPLQMIFFFRQKKSKPYNLGISLLNTFFKSYRMIFYLGNWNYKNSGSPVKRTIIKDLFLFSVSIYWMSMLYKLTGVECVLYKCGDNDWFKNFKLKVAGGNLRDVASFYLAFFLGLGLPHAIFKTNLFVSFVLYFACYLYFRMFYLFWIVETLAVCILQLIPTLNYQKLIELVHYFLQSRQISGRIRNRVYDTLVFQWYYDRGNYITQESRLVDDIPLNLRDELDKHSLFSTIHSCPLFKEENENFITSLCRRSYRMALPANSVLITFSTQTMCIYIVHKGFVQVNSFLAEDIVSNVGKPFILKSGETFPIIVAFNQIPSVVTARTVTDCELIVLKMEEIVAVMLIHDVLKDVVESLKTTDLKLLAKARPGLSVVEDVHNLKRVDFTKFGKHTAILRILKFIFYRKAINSYGRRFIQWELFRLICIVLGLFMWPFIYGCFVFHPKIKRAFTYILLALETTTWFDLYLRTRTAYYNNRGIYVSHPISTLIHYFTSSFIMDALAFAPYFHVIYLVHHSRDNYDLKTSLIHMGLRLCGMYRIFGFFRYSSTSSKFHYQVEFFNYIMLGIILLNIYVNLIVHQRVTGGSILGPTVPEKSSTFAYYLAYLMRTARTLAKMNFYLTEIHIKEIVFMSVFYLWGIILEVVSYSFFMINYLGSGKRLSDYQYNLRSFVRYLKMEKLEDKYVKEVVDYYEHVWSQLKGINFNNLFSKFPNILHEDILIAVYKSTLSAVSCLSRANDAFFRIMSRNVEEIYMEKDSTIIFEGQVKTYIYFIHKGQCEVKKKSITLCRGSIIGDIKNAGVMKHTVVAKTHVMLLKISSTIFFEQMDNFSQTKKAFEEEVSKYDDFVKSPIEELVEEDAEKVLPRVRPSEIPESEFEPIGSQQTPEVAAMDSDKVRITTANTEARGILHPASGKSKFLRVVFLINAFLTVLLVPIFVGIHSLSLTTMAITYVMDVVWLFKIGVTLRTAVANPKTGILSYRKKVIFRNYLYKLDGFIVDVASVLPIELILLTRNKLTGETICFHYCFFLRNLRFFYILRIINKDEQKLSINFYVRWCLIVIKEISMINIFVCVTLLVSTRKELAPDKCYFTLSETQWKTTVIGYLCVIMSYCGGNSMVCKPENNLQTLVETFIALWGCFAKATLFAQTAIIIFRFKGTKFQMIKQLEELENYLVVRNISPALLGAVKRYFINLIDHSHEGGMPIFLKEAPDFIKFHVMKELYAHHLFNCRLFQGVSEIFISQLATRLERFIFFPGNYIVKQGDVDHNMYFIHRGEIYCLEKDKEFATLERPVDLYIKNESFGLMQGLFKNFSHSHSYRAKTFSEVMVLNFSDWEDMREAHPNITKLIYEKALQAETAKETHLKV